MIFKQKSKGLFLAISLFSVLLFAQNANAANNIGDSVTFNVNENFDSTARSQISAELVKISNNLYFYIENSWWDAKTPTRQNEILSNLENLSNEFNNKIYPSLTSLFGSEWRPGIDSDNRITILFHLAKDGVGGYFRSADEYYKLQVPDSNEREMIYLSASNIDSPQAKISLAHEFVHLITFNQKDRLRGIQEDIWLNEARADYASTILGYNDIYEGSNLQRRVKDFLQNPSDSLVEWQESKYDYAVTSMFMHYLVDHYSINILSDSLKSSLVGITSINEALINRGVKEQFGQVFSNWTLATLINDCYQGSKYCYLNQNLRSLKVNPILNFLPLSGNSSLSVTNITKNWMGNWQKIIGGNGDLRLEFSGTPGLNFQVPYITFGKDNTYAVNFMSLDSSQKGQIFVKNFGDQFNSLVLIPSLQSKMSGFLSQEQNYLYTFTTSVSSSVVGQPPNNEQNICVSISTNLYLGLRGNTVRCLQQFLKIQGLSVYPEGLVTGYFGSLTKAAVIRFQKKYGIPSTGFVGVLTRAKINQLINVTQ